jgi:hypothetical protein
VATHYTLAEDEVLRREWPAGADADALARRLERSAELRDRGGRAVLSLEARLQRPLDDPVPARADSLGSARLRSAQHGNGLL